MHLPGAVCDKRLEVLVASRNRITDVRSDIAKAVNLERLELAGNGLEEVPVELNKLKRLDLLDLTGNSLRKSPEALPSSLTVLRLGDNRIGEWHSGRLKHLRELHLWDNDIAELKNEHVKAMPSLEVLNLDGNKLRSLPHGITSLTGLRELVIGSNVLLESLPESIGQLKKLEHLAVDRCSLTSLPASIRELSGLRWLICDFNDMQALPSLPPRLEYLQLNNNRLRSLPSLRACTALERLWFSSNEVTDVSQGEHLSSPALVDVLAYACPLSERSAELVRPFVAARDAAIQSRQKALVEPVRAARKKNNRLSGMSTRSLGSSKSASFFMTEEYI